MIDIGGPTLLRSSAKNFDFVTTITDINDYNLLDKNLSKISSSGFRVASEHSILKHSGLMISIGGDGTMLSCSRKFGLKKVCFGSFISIPRIDD